MKSKRPGSINPPDFQKILFRINVAVTGIVFAVLTPTVRVYQRWFPDKKDSLFLFPLGVIFFSCMLWLIGRLYLPYLIRTGYMADRRREPRPEDIAPKIRFLKMILPIAIFAFHMLVLLVCAFVLVRFMQSDTLEQMMVNLP